MHRFHASSLPRLLRAPRRWALAASLCLLPTAQVLATPLTYNFSGVVTRVTWLLGGAVGDTFSGAFSFDSAPGAGGKDTPFMAFQVVLHASSGPLGFSSTQVGGSLVDGKVRDGVQVFYQARQGGISGKLKLDGGTAGYDATDLVAPLNLAGFNSATLALGASAPTVGTIEGVITSLALARATSVPEPGSLALVALALSGLVGARRQRMWGMGSSR